MSENDLPDAYGVAADPGAEPRIAPSHSMPPVEATPQVSPAEAAEVPVAPVVPPGPPSAPPVAHHVTYAQDEPLPVCDYTGEPGDSDEPCEEPTLVKRWSSAAVITSSVIGALVGGIIVAATLVWALGLVGGARPLINTSATSSSKAVTKTASGTVVINPNDNLDTAEAVAEKVTPSVVNVTIKGTSYNPFTGQQALRDLGNGSGVIIRSDGYILTNNHVVEGADRISVTIGVEDVEAKVVGTDPTTDLAVVKIDRTGLPAIDVGSSKDLKVGQFVAAVGSPFGLEKTVTTGIVSALQRAGSASESGQSLTTYTNLIQTDAAINPGNSGGALVDEQGKLIGINTLIESTSGSSAGIGFAIPVDLATDIANQLIKSGRATHPYIGISSESIDENVAAQYQLPVKAGALIRFVQPGSPAEMAGLKSGDIITRIDKTDIGSSVDVSSALRLRKIGDVVTVTVVRADAERTLKVTLGSDEMRQ